MILDGIFYCFIPFLITFAFSNLTLFKLIIKSRFVKGSNNTESKISNYPTTIRANKIKLTKSKKKHRPFKIKWSKRPQKKESKQKDDLFKIDFVEEKSISELNTNQNCKTIQFSQTEGHLNSDTFPFKTSEYSLSMQRKHLKQINLKPENITYFKRGNISVTNFC